MREALWSLALLLAAYAAFEFLRALRLPREGASGLAVGLQPVTGTRTAAAAAAHDARDDEDDDFLAYAPLPSSVSSAAPAGAAPSAPTSAPAASSGAAEAEAAAAEAAAKKRRLEQVARSEKMIAEIKRDPTIAIKNVRTFKDDLAESLRRGGNISELTQGESIDQFGESKMPNEAKRRKTMVIASIIGLIVLGLVVAGGTWYWVNRAPVTIETPAIKVSSILPAEKNQELYLTGKLPLELRQSIYQLRLQAVAPTSTAAGGGPIINLYPTEALSVDQTTGGAITKTQVDLTRYLAALDLALPVDFRVALGDKFMLGVYQAPEPAIFYLFNVLSYERAGSSLAKNDSSLADTLFSPLLNDPNFSRTLRDNGFKNEVINNVEVRTVRDSNNKIIMIYAFLDQHTLLMTESVDAFQKILGLFQTPLPTTQ